MPVDKIAFLVIFVEHIDDKTRNHTKVIWTHACHQKIALSDKMASKSTNINITKVWFGPVDEILFLFF